ncbi:MAG: DNA gyrase inhibitor YacG [Phycisphaerae bacterium]|nr:DNA gyrase inhibitor YacG [Phycisphaerae bacterium]
MPAADESSSRHLCPICRREVLSPQEGVPGFFPFCSDRCRLIDLGRWLDGKYQIPVVDSDSVPPGNVIPSTDEGQSPRRG